MAARFSAADTPPVTLAPPETVVEIATRLTDAGHETWCVGGAVRDALLGHAHLDWDLATAARPEQVRKLFRRTIPVGIQFGTVGVLDREGRMHEVTTFRRDVKTDGRHAEVEFGASLDEDLARRDFTINAIAYHPLDRRLYDPFEGRTDLARGLVRAVGIAGDRMREDRLRALRALRFAARFGFGFEPETWRAIVESAPHMGRLSAERVKQEIEKTMEQVAKPSAAFRLWRDSGAFAVLVPPLAAVRDDTLHVVDCLALPTLPSRPYRRAMRVAALFGESSGKEAEQHLKALRFSNHDAGFAAQMLDRLHGVGEEMLNALPEQTVTPSRIRRWVAAIGRLRIQPFFRLLAARLAAHDGGANAAQLKRLYRQAQATAFREPVEIGDLSIDGDDLRQAGIPPGPHTGRILAALLDIVLDDPTRNDRSLLLSEAAARYAALRATP